MKPALAQTRKAAETWARAWASMLTWGPAEADRLGDGVYAAALRELAATVRPFMPPAKRTKRNGRSPADLDARSALLIRGLWCLQQMDLANLRQFVTSREPAAMRPPREPRSHGYVPQGKHNDRNGNATQDDAGRRQDDD